jgi:hypothetical protein
MSVTMPERGTASVVARRRTLVWLGIREDPRAKPAPLPWQVVLGVVVPVVVGVLTLAGLDGTGFWRGFGVVLGVACVVLGVCRVITLAAPYRRRSGVDADRP